MIGPGNQLQSLTSHAVVVVNTSFFDKLAGYRLQNQQEYCQAYTHLFRYVLRSPILLDVGHSLTPSLLITIVRWQGWLRRDG
ncbi:hypothetical protein WG66_001677 [Moniliophthora roreri]|nr:hypothetical protein WG66_001677 [Moniliophthora roreri]